jgi:NAD(P)-dependent dehydrogenase (short-subunit alcohol dehydrogenase family)
MADDLSNARVLITAAGSGIGFAIATAFHRAGARVHICDVDPEALATAGDALPGIGATLADVATPGDVDRLFGEALTALGGLDVLVNNAGIAGPTALLEDIDPVDWRRTLAVNLDSQFYCLRRAIPALKAAGGGSVVNLSSTAGLFGYPRRTPYVAAKWAVIGLTKSLAMELGPDGIRVNAICPGSVDGPRMDRVIAAQADALGVPDQEVRDTYTRNASLRTFIKAEDIANMALFLCGPGGAKISGQALAVDGHTESLSD